MSTFQGFNSPLHKTHFLENYVEAKEYPKAILKGKLENIDNILKNGTEKEIVKATLDLHGVQHKEDIYFSISPIDYSLEHTASINILLANYNIEIPLLVKKKFLKVLRLMYQLTCRNKLPHYRSSIYI